MKILELWFTISLYNKWEKPKLSTLSGHKDQEEEDPCSTLSGKDVNETGYFTLGFIVRSEDPSWESVSLV